MKLSSVSIERRPKSWNIANNLKLNQPYQPYLSLVSNLSRSSNSLNSASDIFSIY